MTIRTLAVLAALVAATPLAAQTSITPGQTVTATLRESDRRMHDGLSYDAYAIRGRPGEYVLVQMRSAAFDTYLHWGAFTERGWMGDSEDDDSGGGTDSRLIVRLGPEGTHELRATAFGDDEGGEYELRVTAMGEPPAGRIRPGQSVQGRLETTDYEGPEGFEDHYVLQGVPGDTVTIYTESDELDAYTVAGPWRDGALRSEPPHGDGCGAGEVVMVLEDAPVHHVVVRGFGWGGQTGAYTLRVVSGAHYSECEDEDSGAAPGDVIAEMAADSAMDPVVAALADSAFRVDLAASRDTNDAVAAADTGAWTSTTETEDVTGEPEETDETVVKVYAASVVRHRLGDGSLRDPDGRYYRDFTYSGYAGDRLKVRLSSRELDPRLRIGFAANDGFQALVQDEDGGPGRNAHVTWTVPESREYTLRITTAAPGESGAFVLRVRSRVQTLRP